MTGTAILLLGRGGPEDAEQVAAFVERAGDTATGRSMLPGFLAAPLARLRRAREVDRACSEYGRIGGSPVRQWMSGIVRGLQIAAPLSSEDPDLAVVPATLWGTPSIDQALIACRRADVAHLITVPLCPVTQEQALRAVEIGIGRGEWQPEIRRASCAFDLESHWDAVAWRVRRALSSLPVEARARACVLYVAPPGDDAWVDRVERCLLGIQGRIGMEASSRLSLSGRVGPRRRAGLDTEVRSLAAEFTGIVIVALCSTTDDIETLYDIDVIAAGAARAAGLQHVTRAASLNADPDYIAVLADSIRDTLTEEAG